MQSQMPVVLKPAVIVMPNRTQLNTQFPLFNYRAIPSPIISPLRLRCSTFSGAGGDPDAIILHVEGMMCDGCVANVKRILESRPQVSSATVNLASQTAIVVPVLEEISPPNPNWHNQLGEALAHHLTTSGFNSTFPLPGQEDTR